MFAGLFLASLSTVVFRGALFQRKSRSGWLEELDGIREEALDTTGDDEDIWTDLRAGGEYTDPHEISSLYATDDTPDLPVTKPVHKATAKSASKSPRRGGRSRAREDAPHPPADALPPPPAAVLPPPPASTEPLPAESLPTESLTAASWDAPEASAAMATDSEQIWVEPAPHPVRPSEMWHPAELAPMPLADRTIAPVPEERVDSADLFDLPAVSAPEPIASTTEQGLEAELAAAADLTVIGDPAVEPLPTGSTGSALITGPVARRVRRDRPPARVRNELPVVPDDTDKLLDRGERSPLPEEPLPPAAPPTPASRLPGPARDAIAPDAVVHPPTVGPYDLPAEDDAAEPIAEAPEAPEVVAEAPEPVAVEPEPEVVAAVSDAAEALVADAAGLVDVAGTIVRLGGSVPGSASREAQRVTVTLDGGWCWVSPGDGAGEPVRVVLPRTIVHVDAGASLLAVAEADGSAFIVVADGGARLERGDADDLLAGGSICMVDPAGAIQVDQATPAEIEGDPLVAENLALDAEL